MAARRSALLTVGYYVLLGLLLVLVVAKVLPHLLPLKVARHIGSDSEGYVLALLLPLWLQFARPRLTGTLRWPATLAAAGVCFAVFLVLYQVHSIVGTVRTLNETFFALALLLPYVMLRRRPSVPVAVGLCVLLVALIVGLEQTGLAQLVTNLAEGTIMLVLAPVVLDAVDRPVLGSGPLSWRGRALLLLGLAVVPLVVIALRHAGLPGWAHDADGYVARAQEAFVGFWLVVAYLGLHRSLEWPARHAQVRQGSRVTTAA